MIYKYLGNKQKQGVATLLFRIKKDSVMGVCLEMNIVKEGKDFEKVKRELIETVQDYVEIISKESFPGYLLSRPAPKQYWEIYKKYLQSELKTLEVREKSKIIPNWEKNILIEKAPLSQLVFC